MTTPGHQPVPNPDDRDFLRIAGALNELPAKPDGVAPALVRLLATELDCEGCVAAMRSDDALSVVASSGSVVGAIGQDFIADCPQCRRAMAERRVIISNGVEFDPPLHSDLPQGGGRRMLVAPLVAGDEIVGVVVARNPRGRVFHAGDAAFAARLADLLALAVHNAVLFRSATQSARRAEVLSMKSQQLETERRSREIAEAAAAIARGALESSDARRTAALALQAIERAVPSLGRAIGLMEGNGTTLRYLAASGILEDLSDRSILLAESAAALTARNVDQGSLDLMREGDVVPVGCSLIPLVANERTIGVLLSAANAGSDQGADLETLRNLAASLALAADVLLLNEKEQTRRAREHMLATALATMDQAVLILGLDRHVLYANVAATLEYGYPFDSSPSIGFEQLVDSAAVARRIGAGNAAEAAGIWEAEHMHRRSDGSLFPASVLLSYIRDAGNFPVGQVVTIRNLTHERRIEERLRQSEKLAALGELVAGVAHELNNPLAGISTFAQLLLEDDLDEEQHESVRLIKREADRAVGVIRDLLIFSRKSGPTQSHVNVNEMVELTLRLRGYALRSAGIDVRLELAPSLPTVPGDSQRLQQVLLNLIINAEYALHRAETKRLVVRSERTRDGVCLVVMDTGAGMDEETRQRVFEPFFTTKPAGEGTGLGLSVSYGIVRAHGGLIDVQSAPGGGTVFRIELPERSPTKLAAEA